MCCAIVPLLPGLPDLTNQSIDMLFLSSQGKYTEAEQLCERCQAIKENVLGGDHSSFAQTLNQRAGLLIELVRPTA